MNGGKSHAGYTIVEVMIVLAVSSVMFLIAANFISGKQARTAFTSGTNTFNTRMQELITQVENGQFSDVSFSCSASGNAAKPIAIDSSVAGSQGSNSDCVFVGKFVHFGVDGDKTKYDVMLLAGLDGQLVGTAFKTVSPITKDVDNASTNQIDITKHLTIPQGLNVVKTSVGAANTPVYGLAFLQDPSGTSSNQVIIGYVGSLGANASEAATGNAFRGGGISTNDRAAICLSDGTRYGVIEIGDSSTSTASSMTTRLRITTKTDTACV